jgi:hypothetical protein
MRRVLLVLAAALAAALLFGPAAYAGSPHFVDDTIAATRSGDTLTVSGKEAGLGDESQVHIVLEATASCINPGEQFPQAANKETVSASVTVPVQNGKALWSIDLTASFQPSSPCPDPMFVMFGDVTVTDVTNGLTATVVGPF